MIRRAAVGGFMAMAGALVLASASWACTAFSTITLSAPSGPPKAQIEVKGSSAAANQPVTLRWDSRTGAPVAQAVADAEGNFTVSVLAPANGGGAHFLVAIDGEGQVARGGFEVTPAGGDGPAAFNATGGSASASSSAGGIGSASPDQWLRWGATVLGLGLMAMVPVAGVIVLARPKAGARPRSAAVR